METKSRGVRAFFEEMDKKIKWAIIGQVIVVLLCLGVLGGIKIEDSRIQKQRMLESGYGTTIAIVNMDEGAMVGGELVYYSNTFIDSLSANFTVVSAQAAQVGLENGVYGGIVILPSDMSKNIMTISSTNPISVVLSYEINDNLPEASYISVFESISNLQKAINNSCSYVYISSMMQEIHRAQDNVTRLFENDQNDLASVNQLRNTNFMKGLTLEALPEIKVEFESVNFDSFGIATETFTTDLYNLYTEWYTEEVKEYAEYLEMLEKLVEDIQEDNDKYLKELAKALSDMNDALGDLNTYKSELETYKSQLKTYRDELDTYKDELDDLYGYLDTEMNALGLSSLTPPSVTPPTELVTTAPTAPSSVDSIILPTMPKSLQDNLAEFEDKVLNTFNASDNDLDELELKARGIVSIFDTEISKINSSYEAAERKNQSMMQDNISQYSKFAQDTYMKANEQYAKDAEVLKSALETFYNSKYATSQENQKYLTEFENMLSNSRNDSVLNSNFVDFVVSPIELSGNPYREATDSNAIWRTKVITAMLIISFMLSLMILVLIFISVKKRRGQLV